MLRRHHGRSRAILDFTSLVDVALVLVVFFLLSAQAANLRNLPVTLPQAGTSTAPAAATVEVVIDHAGAISVQGKPVEMKALGGLVGHAHRVTILADAQAKHGRVVEVVDLLRRAGVADIYYATRPLVEDW